MIVKTKYNEKALNGGKIRGLVEGVGRFFRCLSCTVLTKSALIRTKSTVYVKKGSTKLFGQHQQHQLEFENWQSVRQNNCCQPLP